MRRQVSLIEVVMFAAVMVLMAIMAIVLITGIHWIVALLAALAILAFIFFMMRYSMDPDRLRARQSERTLSLAAQTLPYMRQGLTVESAQAVCKLLLPATLATSVAITDRKVVMGFAGTELESHRIGSDIQTLATRKALADGKTQVVTTKEGIGFPSDLDNTAVKAVIVVPLIMRDEPVGVLKFYYRSPKKIDATQVAMAQGLGGLLEMQLQLAELEYQRELATSMSLKALQAQINPHFLFNTINTIASLIRTNPVQARILLREFAVFYRRTLESSQDHITLEQELMQTLRYLGFEIARFGEDRILLESTIQTGLEKVQVPAFIIQPLVENAVGHGMRDDQPLNIWIIAANNDGQVSITVRDNGVGMTKDDQDHMLDENREHAGIAMRNVDERLSGFFGRGAGLAVQSEVGVGTTVTLTLGAIEQLKVVDDDKGDHS